MAADDLNQKFGGDPTQLLNAYHQVSAALVKQEQQMANLSAKSRKQNAETASSTDDVTAAVGRWAVGIFSVSAAYQLVGNEIRRIIDLQKMAETVSMDVNVARQQALLNMPGISNAAKKQAMDAVGAMSVRTGVNEKYLQLAFGQLLSSTGVDVPLSLRALEQGAHFMKHKPEELDLFGAAITDLGKLTRSRDPEVNLGLLAFASGQSRVADPRMQAEHVPQGLLGLGNLGATMQEATAFYGAITNYLPDPSGELSRTIGIKTAESARRFAVSRRGKRRGEEMSLDEMLEWIRADRKRSEQFLEEGEFGRSMGRAAMRNFLLDPTSPFYSQYKTFLGQVPDQEGLRQEARKLIAGRKVDPTESLANVVRQAEVTREQINLLHPEAAMANAVREAMSKTRDALGTGYMESRVSAWMQEVATEIGTKDPLGFAAGRIRGKIADLESDQDIWIPGTGEGPRGYSIGRTPVTRRDLEIVAILRQLLSVFEQARGELQTQTNLLNRSAKKGQSTLAPVNRDQPQNVGPQAN